MQTAVGLPQEGEDLVFLLQARGFFLHPAFQHRIALRQLFRHIVQRHAERRHLVASANLRALGKIASAHRAGHTQQLFPRAQQARAQPDDGEHQQQRHSHGHDALDPDNVFNPLFGGVIEGGNQLVYTVDKPGDIGRHRGLILRVAHARRQLQLPVVLQRLELPLLIVMARGVLQFRAKDGCRHFIQQLFIVFAQRYCRQQAIALHAQRTGFINGVRAALDAVHQARRDRHSGDADEGSQQNDQRELIHQRQRRKKTFQHGVRGS